MNRYPMYTTFEHTPAYKDLYTCLTIVHTVQCTYTVYSVQVMYYLFICQIMLITIRFVIYPYISWGRALKEYKRHFNYN